MKQYLQPLFVLISVMVATATAAHARYLVPTDPPKVNLELAQILIRPPSGNPLGGGFNFANSNSALFVPADPSLNFSGAFSLSLGINSKSISGGNKFG